MLMVRHGVRMVGEFIAWARSSGRLWIPLLLPMIVIAAMVVASSKVVVTTIVYTLF